MLPKALCSSTQPRVSRSVVSMTDRPASHEGHGGGKALGGYAHHDDYAAMFRSRFWMSLVLSVPVVLYSHMIQMWLGFSMP